MSRVTCYVSSLIVSRETFLKLVGQASVVAMFHVKRYGEMPWQRRNDCVSRETWQELDREG